MAFKWPDVPSLQNDLHVLADYAELKCWQNQRTSKQELISTMVQLDDNDYASGVPEEDSSFPTLDQVFDEISRRQMDCAGGYPFRIDPSGHVLYPATEDQDRFVFYKYLLLATRLNMNTRKVQAGLDGTEIFEHLAAQASKSYFGSRSEALVFGSRAGISNFPGRVDQLCAELNEGEGFSDRDPKISRQKDGKLDIVVWKPFADNLPGKLVAFGQCKTGSSYDANDLHPEAFCEKWMSSALPVKPLRLFLVAEALLRARWIVHSIDNGLQFDRCRIVAHCKDIDTQLMDQIAHWTHAAATSHDLPGLN